MEDINTRSDLVEWIDAKLAQLNGKYPDAFASDYWPCVWDNAIAFSDALGLGDEVDALGGQVRLPSYVVEVNGQYDYKTPQKAVRDKVSKRLVGLRLLLTGNSGDRQSDAKTDTKKKKKNDERRGV